MSEQAPQIAHNEHLIHQTLEEFVDPSLGHEASQIYPHEQGRSRVLQGFGQELNNIDGSVTTERTLTASGMQNNAQIHDGFDHRGFTTLQGRITSTQPKGVMAKLKGEKPQVIAQGTEAIVSHVKDARPGVETEGGNTSIKRMAFTREDGNSKDMTVHVAKYTTHASRGNKKPGYTVKFSSKEKEQQYGELVQRLAIKGIKRASSHAHAGNKTIINRYTGRPNRAA